MKGLAEIWAGLRQLRREGEGWKSRRIAEEAPCAIRAAISVPGGEPALLIEVPARAIDSAIEYPEGRGFRLFPESVRPGPNGEIRLCLVLAERAFDDIFGVLAEDVVGSVIAAADHQDAIKKIFARLRAWQAFMRRGADGLSAEEQTGLYGELLFLDGLLELGVNADRAIEGWSGANSGLRDFCLGAVEVEVKAGVGAHATHFHVSHLDQLDEGTVGRLLLCHYHLVEDERGGSLPELVSLIRRRLDPLPFVRIRFDALLIAAGYADLHDHKYGRRLVIRHRCIFEVGGEFPRLLRHEVRPGIEDAGYSVDLRSCFPYEVVVENVARLLMASGDTDVRA